MRAPVLVLACPFSLRPLLPPGSLPPFFAVSFLCVCVFCSAPPFFGLFCCRLSLFLPPMVIGTYTVFWPLLVFCRSSRVFFRRLGASFLCSALNSFRTFLVLLNDCGPRRSPLTSCVCPPPCFGGVVVSFWFGLVVVW